MVRAERMIRRRDPFQAIADPTRRAILVLLAAQAMSAGDIAARFEIARPAISKHIKILNECELIRSRPEGRQIYYSLNIDKMNEIDVWLDQLRRIWQDRFGQLDSLLSNLQNSPDRNKG